MIDKHLHLSGSASARTLWELVYDSGYKTGIKTFNEFENFTSLRNSGSLDAYLKVLHWLDKIQSSPLAVKACVYDAYVSSFMAGCEELELRFNATKRSQDGTIDLDAIIISARAGLEMASSRFGIKGSLAMCLGWDCSDEANWACTNKAIDYVGKGITTIDIAGPSHLATDDKRQLFTSMFDKAKKGGLVTTCHAGEIVHDSLEAELEWTLYKLRPDRIGHGIQLVKYPKLLAVAAANCEFEICISSNIASGAVTGLEEFVGIFKALEHVNAKWTLCTDATFPLGTNIAREHYLFDEIKKLA
jgi:adenosine deaminase